jgi:hypothetical protein
MVDGWRLHWNKMRTTWNAGATYHGDGRPKQREIQRCIGTIKKKVGNKFYILRSWRPEHPCFMVAI